MNYGGTQHPRDMTAVDLQRAVRAARRPDLLTHLAEISRCAFGFYTSHFPHTINYPWVAEALEDLAVGSRVLDIGAGVGPLPLWLGQKGMFVDCVDKHVIVRMPPISDDWNEWGFFDYAQLHPNLTAHHCAIGEFRPVSSFDAIYSVSVLAHMTRVVREDTLRRCGEWLRPGGRLLFAIDVIPSSDFLWTHSEGVEVEPPLKHGAINSVLDQLITLGFHICEARVLRNVPKSRTDLFFINCTLG